MINKLWIFLIISGSISLILSGKSDILNEQILSSGKVTLELVMQIFPLISLWLGIMKIAEKSGLLKKLSKLLYPLLHFLFPEIPKGHESLSYISSNIICNMFGLGNASTPFGLKAMESMQKINNKKDTATHSMITFLIINTCGLCLVPTTIISLRMLYKSENPTSITIPCIIVSFLSLLFGLFIDKIYQYKDRSQK